MASTTERSERNEAPAASKAESILAAAKRTFLESGFGAVSMDTIAREAGVSKATVYAHFAGKEELFGAVIGGECERYLADFSAGELDPGDVRASLTILGPPVSRTLAVARRDRTTPHHIGRSQLASRRSARCSGVPDPSATSPRSKPFCAARPLPESLQFRRHASRRRAIRRPGARRNPAASPAASRSRRRASARSATRRRRRRHLPARLRPARRGRLSKSSDSALPGLIRVSDVREPADYGVAKPTERARGLRADGSSQVTGNRASGRRPTAARPGRASRGRSRPFPSSPSTTA